MLHAAFILTIINRYYYKKGCNKNEASVTFFQSYDQRSLTCIKELVRVNGISPRPNEEDRNTVPFLFFISIVD